MKVAFVVQRSGKDVFGGAEALTLQIGMILSKYLDVEILTTRARDASTWENYYPEGVEKIDNLIIRRFSVDKTRDPQFVPLSQYLEQHNDDLQKGIEFLNASGPVCNSLLKFIDDNKNNYDLFIFVGYLYWQTYFGMALVKEKSILLPTAHDEPWIHFKVFDSVFEMALGYLFLTNSEKEFVHKKYGYVDKPFKIVGHGLNLEIPSKSYKNPRINLPEEYLLYIGRISSGKGCQLLSDFYNKYIETHDVDIGLVMIGNMEQQIKNSKAIILENLSDEKKFYVLKNCKVFIMPSFYESLNIACLEAWLFKKPVLVNAHSEVLKEHCINGQCGLYFRNYEEFTECLDLILENIELEKILGNNGEKYVRENYNWQITKDRYVEFFKNMILKLNSH